MVFETLGSVTEMQKQAADTDQIRLSGVFGICGVKNNNRRTYSKENYGKMVESLQQVIATEGCLGELEHPESMNINLNNVSHKIESVEMLEDGTVQGTILLLNTDKGKNAKAIVEAGVPLYISSRALGNIDANGNVTLTSLKTYDLVGTPGFSQAKLNQLKESNQAFECLNENCYAVLLEADDLLGGGDDEEDKKDDEKKEKKDKESKDKKEKKSEEKTEDAPEEKTEDTSDDDTSDDDKKDDSAKDDKEEGTKEVTINVNNQAESEDDKDKKENTKNKDNSNSDMEDIKKELKSLNDKIESLEASLHVAKESIQPVKYDAIENWVREEFGPRMKEELVAQIAQGTEKYVDEAIAENNDKVEAWVHTEYTPMVENWATNEFAPMLEAWVTKEFAPVVENWVSNEFAPVVENWVSNEFGPIVESWVTKEFAPVLENWTVEQFGEKINEWINSEVKPNIMESVNENVSAYMENQLAEIKESKLDNIDSMLRAIESDTTKSAADVILENAKRANDAYATFPAIQNMPNEYRPLWEMLSDDRKNQIALMSRAYDYTKEGVLESFWAGVDFTQRETKVVENVQPQMTFANSVASQMMKMWKR